MAMPVIIPEIVVTLSNITEMSDVQASQSGRYQFGMRDANDQRVRAPWESGVLSGLISLEDREWLIDFSKRFRERVETAVLNQPITPHLELE